MSSIPTDPTAVPSAEQPTLEQLPAGVSQTTDPGDEPTAAETAEIVRRARLLSKISVLADDNFQKADPAVCLDGIRGLLIDYDRHTPTEPVTPLWPDSDWEPGCPAWCSEHYTVDDERNHSSYPWAVTGESANREGVHLMVSTWIELREGTKHDPAGRRAVGIIEKIPEDVELTAGQLRDFARYLVAVAELVEEASAR
jgi:hypothetical protein